MLTVSSTMTNLAIEGANKLEASGEDMIAIGDIGMKVLRDGSQAHEERKGQFEAMPIPFEVNGKRWWVTLY